MYPYIKMFFVHFVNRSPGGSPRPRTVTNFSCGEKLCKPLNNRAPLPPEPSSFPPIPPSPPPAPLFATALLPGVGMPGAPAPLYPAPPPPPSAIPLPSLRKVIHFVVKYLCTGCTTILDINSANVYYVGDESVV